MVLHNKMKIPTKLPETSFVSIHEANVTGLVWIDYIEIHVGGISEGGNSVAHKPPREGTDLIKGHLVVGREDFDLVPHVRIPFIYPNDSLWSGVNFSHSRCRGAHDIVQSELDVTIIEEFQDLSGMIFSGRYFILFPPCGGIGDEIPPILPLLHLRLE